MTPLSPHFSATDDGTTRPAPGSLPFVYDPVRRPMPEVTPYRLVFEDSTEPFHAKVIEESNEYIPELSMWVPAVRICGYTDSRHQPRGAVLLYHADSPHKTLALRVMDAENGGISFPHPKYCPDEVHLSGYGSVLILGPLVVTVATDQDGAHNDPRNNPVT